jgi:hypothetical protein
MQQTQTLRRRYVNLLKRHILNESIAFFAAGIFVLTDNRMTVFLHYFGHVAIGASFIMLLFSSRNKWLRKFASRTATLLGTAIINITIASVIIGSILTLTQSKPESSGASLFGVLFIILLWMVAVILFYLDIKLPILKNRMMIRINHYFERFITPLPILISVIICISGLFAFLTHICVPYYFFGISYTTFIFTIGYDPWHDFR